jgi:hypothetical protein
VSRSAFWALAVGLIVTGASFWLWQQKSASTETVFQPKLRGIEPPSLCPWREPDSDLRQFFPDATGWQAETRILSGQRLQLAERLGRPPDLDENSLRVYRVLRNGRSVGSVLTRRVKGEYGAIELVLGLDQGQRVLGLRLQRLREPEAVARALQDSGWLASFRGKNASSDWRLGASIPDVPPDARASADHIVQGVRSLLILDAVAGDQSQQRHH